MFSGKSLVMFPVTNFTKLQPLVTASADIKEAMATAFIGA